VSQQNEIADGHCIECEAIGQDKCSSHCSEDVTAIARETIEAVLAKHLLTSWWTEQNREMLAKAISTALQP
jgi:hypothetical protein